jgi:hypothetical protein
VDEAARRAYLAAPHLYETALPVGLGNDPAGWAGLAQPWGTPRL